MKLNEQEYLQNKAVLIDLQMAGTGFIFVLHYG